MLIIKAFLRTQDYSVLGKVFVSSSVLTTYSKFVCKNNYIFILFVSKPLVEPLNEFLNKDILTKELQ